MGLSSRKLCTAFSCARDLGKPEQGQHSKEDELHDRVPAARPAHRLLGHPGVPLNTLLSQEDSPLTHAQRK